MEGSPINKLVTPRQTTRRVSRPNSDPFKPHLYTCERITCGKLHWTNTTLPNMETSQRPPPHLAFSSSPAFATPLHPIPPAQAARPPPPPAFKPSIPTVLPILLPPPTLRPLAFRTFTKKHNLTLTSSALQALATFIGRHCGSAWREEGSGEKVLEEVAKLWKAEAGAVIVEDGEKLKMILKTLEGSMSGGRIGLAKTTSNLSRQSSFAFSHDNVVDLAAEAHRPSLDGHRNSSFGMSKLQVEEEEEGEESGNDARAWLNVISAFQQPRLSYDVDKKHFTTLTSKPSLFPSASHKTTLFRERYHVIQQRLLRNEAFQTPSFGSATTTSLARNGPSNAQRSYKLTPIANLLGRGGSSHLLLGMLAVAPAGTLALNDLSGSISLDLQHAKPIQGEDTAFFCPGMIVLVDGVYEEDWAGAGASGLGNTGGVGGTIGGRFVAFNISGPPVEKRNISLGIDLKSSEVGGGFGWVDFLGFGSERAVGSRMRRLEQRLLGPQAGEAGRQERGKMVVLAEVTLDRPETFAALRKVLDHYIRSPDEPPMTFLLMGNFTSTAAMAGASTGSIEYKEMFNELAAVLAEYPTLLRSSTWVFVPGDNDPWSSAFSAGAGAPVPRNSVPDVFTSRIKRAFATAKTEAGAGVKKEGIDGEAVWTSNPTRLSFFGPVHEVAVFRDDLSGRLRRNAVRMGQAVKPDEPAGRTNGNNALSQPSGDDDITMSGALPLPAESQMDPEVAEAMTLDPPAAATTEGEDDFGTQEGKRIILSLLPQGTLSPFPLTTRPTHWDYSSALSLYPLPHALVLADADAPPFAVTFEGCHVINPGRLVGAGAGRRKKVQWMEYDVFGRRGVGRSEWVG